MRIEPTASCRSLERGHCTSFKRCSSQAHPTTSQTPQASRCSSQAHPTTTQTPQAPSNSPTPAARVSHTPNASLCAEQQRCFALHSHCSIPLPLNAGRRRGAGSSMGSSSSRQGYLLGAWRARQALEALMGGSSPLVTDSDKHGTVRPQHNGSPLSWIPPYHEWIDVHILAFSR